VTDFVQIERGESTLGSTADSDASASTRTPFSAPRPSDSAASTPVPTGSPSRWVHKYRRVAVAMDLGAGAVAAAVGCFIRFGESPTALYVGLSALVPLVWVLAVALMRGYENRYLGVGPEEYRSLIHAALIAVTSYLLRLEIARGYVVLVFPLVLVLSLVLRHELRRSLLRRRRLGLAMQRTVVVGRADSVASMIREINRSVVHGIQVVGACVSGLDDGRWQSSTHIEGVPVFGRPEDALAAVDLVEAEVVAVSSHPDLVGHSLRRLAWSLEERQVELIVAPGILEVAGPRLSIRPAAGLSVLHVERPVMSGSRRVIKRAVDQLLTLGITLAALPVLVGVALAVRLTSPGPIFFRQERVGARGETFQMVKFRTMVVNAEEVLANLAGGHDTNAVLFKMKDDPRITRVGKVLRRFSLDELPQLVNVLRGEMSLVGPRPPLPREVAVYESDAVRRLRVRPGLTGLWQVSGRSDLSWEESLRLDLWYVDNWSLILDVQILVRTAKAVLRGSGAY